MITCSGSGILEGLNLLDHVLRASISDRTFYNIQQAYLIHAVGNIWSRHQAVTMAELQQPARLAGDAWCDSPGHTAKYGSYSIMEATTSKIVYIELVQVLETRALTLTISHAID